MSDITLTDSEKEHLNNMNPSAQLVQLGTKLQAALNGTFPAGSVGTSEIEDLAVTTGKINDSAVTNAKLGTDVKIGSLAALTTTTKTSIQAAIDELVTADTTKLAQTSNVKNIVAATVTLNGQTFTPISFGANSAATVTSTNPETYDLTGVGDGGTIIMNPDGAGNKTATINFGAGTSTSGATPSTDISGETDSKFNIAVNGGAPSLVTLTIAAGLNSGANIAAEMQTKIQALGGAFAAVTVDYNVTVAGKYTITSAQLGTGSSVVVTPATSGSITEELKIGVADGGTETIGTGDVANAAAVTAAEIAAVMTADMAGITASGASGSVVASSDTTGAGSTIVVGNGTLNAVIGFTNTDEFYGSQGLNCGDFANANYIVQATITGTAAASLGSLDIGTSNKATTGFRLECETTSDTSDIDLTIFGEIA